MIDLRPPRQQNLLLIAAREPVPGFTKTRLGREIGMGAAAALYRAFLADLIERFTPPALAGLFDLGWAFTPAESDFPGVIGEITPAGARRSTAIRYVPQYGDGWGERQANLLRWGARQGYARTVLTASDSPQMPVAVIETAFAALTEHDVALGRVHDGGYYLIGLRGYHDVLSGVPMSTSRAADALRAQAEEQGLCVAELPPTFDVDEVTDLPLLTAALAPDGATAPATWRALRRLDGIVGFGVPVPVERALGALTHS